MKTVAAICVCLWTWSVSAQINTNYNNGTSYTNINNGSTNGNNSTGHRVIAGPFTNVANGHFYYLLAATTWSNSEATAVFYGGHLVTINDADENQWVVDTFANSGGASRPLWLGLADRDSEGNFVWVSGETSTYRNWNTLSGEPNNSGGSGYEEDFSYIIQQDSGNPTVLPTFWNDVPNDGYGVIPPIYGVMETAVAIDPPPNVVTPPVAQVRPGCVEVCWQSTNSLLYQVQWNAMDASTNWVNLGSPLAGTGSELCVIDTPHGTNRVYRITILP